MTRSSDRKHWLIGVAARAGLGDLSHVMLPPETATVEAWKTVAAEAGISQIKLAQHVGEIFRVKVAHLNATEPSATTLLPEQQAQKLLVLPVRATDRQLMVATADPLDIDAEREISFVSGRTTVFEVCPPAPLRQAINEAYRLDADADFVMTDEALREAAEHVRFEGEPPRTAAASAHAWEKVEVTDLILLEAVKCGADAIQIGPMETGGRVRFRVDEVVETFLRVPDEGLLLIMDRLLALAGMERDPRRESQSGRIRAHIQDVDYTLSLRTMAKGRTDQILLRIGPASPTHAEARESAEDLPTLHEPAPTESLALVVDDTPADRLLMRAIMERVGFKVVEAEGGESAMTHLEGVGDFGMLLLDLNMPGVDGLEVLGRVRRTMKTTALPVIIMTASEDSDDKAQLLAAGANDYLQKPYDPTWAVKRVEAVLRRSRTGSHSSVDRDRPRGGAGDPVRSG